MPADPIHYQMQPSPGGLWGLVAGLSAAFVVAAWELLKKISRTKRARQMLAQAIDPKSEEKDNSEESAMSAQLLEILRRMETDRQEETRQRDRQWEVLGQCVQECRTHSANLLAVVSSIQNMAFYMDDTHKRHAEQVREVGANVIRLSEYLRDRMGGGQNWPSFHQRPPMQAGAGS